MVRRAIYRRLFRRSQPIWNKLRDLSLGKQTRSLSIALGALFMIFIFYQSKSLQFNRSSLSLISNTFFGQRVLRASSGSISFVDTCFTIV